MFSEYPSSEFASKGKDTTKETEGREEDKGPLPRKESDKDNADKKEEGQGTKDCPCGDMKIT